MKSLCIFCGSNPGQGADYLDAARAMGRAMARRDITLVYGGGSIGLMGAVADATLNADGRAVGVIPRFLWDKEVGHQRLTGLFIVETMHERKSKMADLADAFAVMPGGLGTLEEFFEVWTWGNLGLHNKPVGVLNINGYYDGLLSALDTMTRQGFVKSAHRQSLKVASDPEALIEALSADQPAASTGWRDAARA